MDSDLSREMPMPKYYEITLIGRLDPHWSGGLFDLDFTQMEKEEILLLGL